MEPSKFAAFLWRTLHRIGVSAGAFVLTTAFFLVLPLMQQISKPPSDTVALTQVDTAALPPPPPPPEPEPEEEEEQEEEPPELAEDTQPLDLSMLELALNPTFGDSMLGGDFQVKLDAVTASGGGLDELFNASELDQKPRVIYQASPTIDAKMRKRTPATVTVLFVVDERGRVENPMVQSSTDPIFERPALSAIKQWRFEPGKRQGEPVTFRMKIPITFPKGK